MQFSLIVNPFFNRKHCWPVEHVQRWTRADDTTDHRGAPTASDDIGASESHGCVVDGCVVDVSVDVHFVLFEVTNGRVMTFQLCC